MNLFASKRPHTSTLDMEFSIHEFVNSCSTLKIMSWAFFLLQKRLGHKSMEKINVACTQICFIFLFVLFENIGELASKAWEKKERMSVDIFGKKEVY